MSALFGDLLKPTHLIFIFIIVMVIFGPKRLPELGHSLGKGIKEFKGSITGTTGEAPSDEKKPQMSENEKKA